MGVIVRVWLDLICLVVRRPLNHNLERRQLVHMLSSDSESAFCGHNAFGHFASLQLHHVSAKSLCSVGRPSGRPPRGFGRSLANPAASALLRLRLSYERQQRGGEAVISANCPCPRPCSSVSRLRGRLVCPHYRVRCSHHVCRFWRRRSRGTCKVGRIGLQLTTSGSAPPLGCRSTSNASCAEPPALQARLFHTSSRCLAGMSIWRRMRRRWSRRSVK